MPLLFRNIKEQKLNAAEREKAVLYNAATLGVPPSLGPPFSETCMPSTPVNKGEPSIAFSLLKKDLIVLEQF